MNVRTFGNANSGINRDIIISLDNGSDPTPGAKVGTWNHNILY